MAVTKDRDCRNRRKLLETGKATQENPVNTKSMERHQKVNKVVKKMKVIFPTYSTYYWEPCMEQLGKKLT